MEKKTIINKETLLPLSLVITLVMAVGGFTVMWTKTTSDTAHLKELIELQFDHVNSRLEGIEKAIAKRESKDIAYEGY